MAEIWSPDVFIYYTELPDGVNETVLECNAGYTVYIDPRQSDAGMLRSYQHAMTHIREKDFNKANVQEIEDKAHYGRSKTV